ncbi:hypothetical protein [Ruegeria marina]|uniref:CopL family metal-binding regulatory protein n=1 Tax=Ruegeria marina TaxID=639004 RepID=A0A1G6YAZ4_9RHOB|nr:hypothetical protein [Ruegeria marina]SDD86746.1 hypothetical protein SAMN04488239_11173 [Ruegeria marina]
MTSYRAPLTTTCRRTRFLPWKDKAGSANAGPIAVTQNLVVSRRRSNYFTTMKKFAYSFSAKRLMALIMCLALMITGVAAAVAMEHPGHESNGSVAWAASDPGPMAHASHHMSPGDSDAECCEPDTTAASSCHVSTCCLSELQHSEILASLDHGRSACAQSMVQVVGPSIDTSLPERPPQLS